MGGSVVGVLQRWRRCEHCSFKFEKQMYSLSGKEILFADAKTLSLSWMICCGVINHSNLKQDLRRIPVT